MLEKAAVIATSVGGVASVVLMLMSGLRPPVFLIILFIGWILAPFMALGFTVIVFRRRPMISRRILHWLTLVIAAGSMVIYAYVLFRPPASQPAFPYVAVPIGSWVIILGTLSTAAVLAGRAVRE